MSASASTAINSFRTFSVRQDQIIDAAQSCFVRNGYNRSTMQDIAKEAAMSSPNIYRYFVSKEAILLAMAERESQKSDARITGFEEAGDKQGALIRLIEFYHLGMTRAHAVLRLEIWSEATRNAEVRAIVREHETNGGTRFKEALASLATSPDCDLDRLFAAISAFLKGIVVNRALVDDYDAAPAVAQVQAMIEDGLAGRTPKGPRYGRSAAG